MQRRPDRPTPLHGRRRSAATRPRQGEDAGSTTRQSTAPRARVEAKLAAEVVPDQVLPKVLTTFGLIAIYVFIIYFITGSSIISSSAGRRSRCGCSGFVVFLVPAGMAVVELGNLWPAQGGVYIWAYRTMNEPLAFFGGFLSWIPVILNGATTPAAIVAFLALAFGAEAGADDEHPAPAAHPLARGRPRAAHTHRDPEGDVHRLRRLRGRLPRGLLRGPRPTPSPTARRFRSSPRTSTRSTSPTTAGSSGSSCSTCSASRRRSTWARSSSPSGAAR